MTSNLDYTADIPLVLIADDDRMTRVLLRRTMEQEGYRVAEAETGEECLDLYKQLQPQVLLLDAVMPRMDGFTCCSQVQALPGGDRIPILMITGLDDQVSVDQAFAAGASDYITKPIHLPVLRQRVRYLLQATRAMEELQQQTERERLLRKFVTQQMHHAFNLEEILTTAVVEVRQFLQADRVILQRFNFQGDGLVVAEAVGDGWKSALGVRGDRTWFQDQIPLYSRGEVSHITHPDQHLLNPGLIDFLQVHQVQTVLTVPVPQGETLWGLLEVHQCLKPRQWKRFEVEALQQLAVQAALAIRQAEINQQLETANRSLHLLATLDGLTQIANRRHFDEFLDQEWRRAVREQTYLSLILGDIDCFKLYNDAYGHQAGDDCLRRVARVIQQSIRRPADLAARYGGEEFAIVLPNTCPEGALQLAEEIRGRVRVLLIEHRCSTVNHYVTMSLGVASAVPCPPMALTDLIAAADRALYEAKTRGRDRVVLQRCFNFLPAHPRFEPPRTPSGDV